jgi:hypothetical protein
VTGFHKIVGIDPNGVPRVYAEDCDEAYAYLLCRDRARSYIRKRPDTGPFSKWGFEPAHELETTMIST